MNELLERLSRIHVSPFVKRLLAFALGWIVMGLVLLILLLEVVALKFAVRY